MDRLRLVRIGTDGRPRLVRPLEAENVTYKQRDTFTVQPGDRRLRQTAPTRRRGGSRAVGESRDNGTISATFDVLADGPYTAAARVERLLAALDVGERDLFVEWRPDGLAHSVFFEVRGPAGWRPLYSALQWPQTHRVPVEISWPVAPDPQGLPLDVYERWTPPSSVDDDGAGAANELLNPTGQDGSTFGWTPRGQNNDDFTASQAWAGEGGWSFRLVRDTDGTGAQTIYQQALIDAEPGQRWSAAALFKSAAVSREGSVRVGFLDATGVEISAATSAVVNTPLGAVGARAAMENQLAPAGTRQVSVRLQVALAAEGEVHYVADAVLVRAAAAPAGRVDGSMDGHRYEGVFSRSRTVALEESRLAGYTLGTSPATTRRFTADGLVTAIPTGGAATAPAAMVAYTAIEPVPDQEVVARGKLLANGPTAGDEYANVLAPGVRYRADDGRCVFATVQGDRLKIYKWDGVALGAALAQSAGTLGADAPALGEDVYLAIRAEGSYVTAEFYGTNPPNARRTNYLHRVTAQLAVSDPLGGHRAGHPVARAWGTAGAVHALAEFNVQSYVYPEQRQPTVVYVPGVPGTAPARVDVELQPDTTTITPAFAMVAARRRPHPHNRAWNGDAGQGTDRWQTAVLGGQLAAGGSVAQVAGPDADHPNAIRVTASATNISGGSYMVAERFKKGHVYTVEFRANRASGAAGWVLRFFYDVATVLPAPAAIVESWSAGAQQFSFIAPADFDRLDVIFRKSGAVAGEQLDVAGLRVFEAMPDDAPPATPRRGRGGRPPFAVIRANERISAHSSAGWSEGGTAADPTMTVAMGASASAHLAFAVDAEAIAPEDFDEDLDVEVWAVGDQPSTWTSPRLRATVTHEDGGATSYAIEDPSGAGRAIPVPTSGTRRRLWRVGAVPLNASRRHRGRYRVELRATSGASSSGNLVMRYLILVPVARSLSTPTGLPNDADYPAFATGLVDYDGAGWHVDRHGYRVRRSGMGGDALEVDPGDVELLCVQCTGVPDSPAAADGTAENLPAGLALVHARVTPRYRLMSPTEA